MLTGRCIASAVRDEADSSVVGRNIERNRQWIAEIRETIAKKMGMANA